MNTFLYINILNEQSSLYYFIQSFVFSRTFSVCILIYHFLRNISVNNEKFQVFCFVNYYETYTNKL